MLVIVAACLTVVAASCADDELPLASPDLQCDGEASGTFEADFDPTVPGAATSDAALVERLDAFIAHQGRGDAVELRDAVQAVVIDGRRVLVVEARPAPAGGYWADTVHYCEPFFAEVARPGETPATEAPATTLDVTAAEPFCADAIAALDREYPTDGAGVIEAFRAIDLQGLDDGDQRSFSGMVSSLESSIEAFTSGQGDNGWTTSHLATLVSRLCDIDAGGFTVMP